MSKAKTQKYIIIGSGVCLKGITETAKGETVELTDAKAAALVGKVVLAKGYDADQKTDKELLAENAKLKKQNDQLTEQLTKLTESMTAKK